MISIRAFVPDDMDTVVELLQDVSTYRPAGKTFQSLAKAFAVQANCYACVALYEGRLVAFGSVFILNRVRGGRSGIIEDVVVAPDLRGKGVGRLIVDSLLAEARKRDCFKVSLEAAVSARPFYAAFGFETGGQIMRILL